MYHPLSIFHLPILPSPSLSSYASSSAFPLLSARHFSVALSPPSIFLDDTLHTLALQHSRILSLSSLPRNPYTYTECPRDNRIVSRVQIDREAIELLSDTPYKMTQNFSQYGDRNLPGGCVECHVSLFFPTTRYSEEYFSIDYMIARTSHIKIPRR